MSGSTRVVLVTGSVRGLGLEIARSFAQRGDRVYVTWRTSKQLTARLESEFTGRVVRLDLLDRDSTFACVKRIMESEGQLDHVVQCAGEYLAKPLAETSTAELTGLWRSNVETSLHLMEAARAALRESRGTAVFLGCAGLEGLRARRSVAGYAAAKSALCVLVRSWALEEGSHGVRVNLVSPGIIPHEHAAEDTHDAELHSAIPLGAPGTPADVAQACLWLSSDQAAHITGVNLPVTGGWQG